MSNDDGQSPKTDLLPPPPNPGPRCYGERIDLFTADDLAGGLDGRISPLPIKMSLPPDGFD